MMNGQTERQFTLVDWAWFAGVFGFIFAGLAIGLTLIEKVVTP